MKHNFNEVENNLYKIMIMDRFNDVKIIYIKLWLMDYDFNDALTFSR